MPYMPHCHGHHQLFLARSAKHVLRGFLLNNCSIHVDILELCTVCQGARRASQPHGHITCIHAEANASNAAACSRQQQRQQAEYPALLKGHRQWSKTLTLAAKTNFGGAGSPTYVVLSFRLWTDRYMTPCSSSLPAPGMACKPSSSRLIRRSLRASSVTCGTFVEYCGYLPDATFLKPCTIRQEHQTPMILPRAFLLLNAEGVMSFTLLNGTRVCPRAWSERACAHRDTTPPWP